MRVVEVHSSSPEACIGFTGSQEARLTTGNRRKRGVDRMIERASEVRVG